MATRTLGVVVQSIRDEKDIRKTYESLLLQEHSPDCKLDIILWCVDCSSQYIDLHRGIDGVHVVQSNNSFLNHLRSSLNTVRHCKLIFVCRSGIVFLPTCLEMFRLQKTVEYGDETSLTAVGVRLFPHEPLKSEEKLREGVHWKMYDHTREDRAVDCLTTDFCCFNINTLIRIAALDDDPVPEAEDVWISFVIGHRLMLPIWKVKSEEVNNVRCTFTPIPETLYTKMLKVDWPKNICKPYYSLAKVNEGRKAAWVTPSVLWEQGFGGVNMPAEPASEIDFAAATSYGVRVIRIGALCDASDLSYLLDSKSNDIQGDRQHLLLVIPRLKQAIQKAAFAGLKIIITMTDLPGSPFHSSAGSTLPFWSSSTCRIRAAKFWGSLAECLVDVKNLIMGYDLINEPYTPEDQNMDYFNDMPFSYKVELNHFYKVALEEIRKHDEDTMVIVKSTWFANPRTIDMLIPLPDSNVVYSFHVYVPPQLTFLRKFKCFHNLSLSYPGPVPKWKNFTHEKVVIDFQYLHNLLSETVHKWQLKHDIPSNRILVAEFGICREVRGSQQYLTDLVKIFIEFRWNWLLFSFRDEEWDAMDYELGTSIDNMLERTPSKLMLCVADHFH